MTESAIPQHLPRVPRWLIEAARAGAPDAERELLRRFEPLVQHVVWRLKLPPGCEREDLAQEARVGLIAAIRAWQPERGSFPALAACTVRRHALFALKTSCRYKHQLLSRAISLDSAQPHPTRRVDEGRTLTLLETLPAHDPGTDPEHQLLVREQLSSILRALPTLTTSERTVVAGDLSGRSYQQMAPTPFRTWRAAEHAHYRARRKLAAALQTAT
jgi:RNA polymerase sigma factor (sigma-70 family)